MNAELQIETVRRKAVWGSRIRMAVALAGAMLVMSCSQSIRTGQASSYLVITSLTGGADNDATVASDVIEDNGGIIADGGQATFQVLMKDTGGLGPSPVNAITITQYHVEYVRGDGRNVPGLDVPFPFDGGLTVTIGTTGGTGFTL